MITSIAALVLLAASSVPQVASPATPAQPPARAAPAVDPALEPLAFMAGTWCQEQPNGAVIEEHWMAPRGKAMLGSFRRTLGNGAVPFYEFTQVVAEKDRVVLRQIHVHGNFDADPKRTVPMTLVLEKAGGGRATFVPHPDPAVANAGDMARITYFRDGDDSLVLVVEPKPAEGKAPEKPLEFRMKRSR